MNQLTERLVLGGFSYEEAFPFSEIKKRSRGEIIWELKGVLSAEALVIASKILNRQGYDCCLKAVEVSEKRFLFYKNLLESEELRNKHLVQLGTEDLTFRIVFAMHGCIVRANKILCHMDNLIGDLIPNSVLAMGIGYNQWNILNLKDPITKCQMTGVCICGEGEKEPYIEGCVSDPTRIIISQREQEKRSEEFHKSFVERIKKKK